MLVTAEIGSKSLSELVRQMQAGDEVLITQDNKPVAKLVAVDQSAPPKTSELQVVSHKGHRVITPIIPQSELADELFKRQ